MALVTQGSLDWVALARTPFTLSFEIAARLASADISVITVGVGRAVGSLFKFPHEGQQELMASISAVKGYGMFGNVGWFGLGIKHVVRTLAETQQGAMCVALCAALTTQGAYSPLMAGTILRELCDALKCPPELTPSTHQWTNIAQVCSGSLTKSRFGLVHSQFFDMLVPKSPDGIRPLFRPQLNDSAFAQALLDLASLSTGSMSNAVFYGSAKCALLAAIAHSLLRLSIQIQDEHGEVIYPSQDRQVPQATFIRQSKPSLENQKALITQRYFVVLAQQLIYPNHLDPRSTVPTQFWTMGATSRQTFLSDTFGEPLLQMLHHRTHVRYLTAALLYMDLWDSGVDVLIPTGVEKRFIDALVQLRAYGRYGGRTASVTGLGRLRLFQRIFPELIPLSTDATTLTLEGPGLVRDARVEIWSHYDSKEPCFCGEPRLDGDSGEDQFRQIQRGGSTKLVPARECILCICWKISLLCNLMLFVNDPMDLQLAPSILAVRTWNLVGGCDFCESLASGTVNWIRLVSDIFSDIALPSTGEWSAASQGGLCVSLPILRNPAMTTSQGCFAELSTGGIAHFGRHYEYIVDGATRKNDLLPFENIISNATSCPIELVVGDHIEPNILVASFRAKYPDGSEYLSGPVASFLRLFCRDFPFSPVPVPENAGLPPCSDDPDFTPRFKELPKCLASGPPKRFWIGWLHTAKGPRLFALPFEVPWLHFVADSIDESNKQAKHLPRGAVRDALPCPGCILRCVPERLVKKRVSLKWVDSFRVPPGRSSWVMQKQKFQAL